MRLASPYYLALILLIIPMWLAYRKKPAALGFPSLGVLSSVKRTKLSALRHLPFLLRCLAVAAISVALARPQSGESQSERTSEGLDIVLVIDTSGSMETRDYVLDNQRPTRLAVVKSVIGDFIQSRASDRIGLVIFGTEAFTQAPLTLDHDILMRFLDRIQIAMAGPATAMGDGIATAVNRLKTIEAKSKVVILLTDGGNNAGRVDPLAAAQAAKTLGVRVYTIGVGAEDPRAQAAAGQQPGAETDLDEVVLKQIAETTGAQYFHAGDTETLVKVYDTIDKLEKSKLKVQSFTAYDERYAGMAALATVLLFGELALGITRFRRIP